MVERASVVLPHAQIVAAVIPLIVLSMALVLETPTSSQRSPRQRQ